MITSSSDPVASTAGLSLLETLLVLAILAAVAGVSIAGLRGPSPALRLEAERAALARKVATARARAVTTGHIVTLDDLPGCEGASVRIVALPSGTLLGPDICLDIDGVSHRSGVDPLSNGLTVRE